MAKQDWIDEQPSRCWKPIKFIRFEEWGEIHFKDLLNGWFAKNPAIDVVDFKFSNGGGLYQATLLYREK